MRTNNSIKNSISAIIQYSIVIILGFVSRTIFIKILGSEYLGLNGLFTNIMTMLSIAELGIGNAIIFNLYKPIAENDHSKIKALMNFYRKAYNIIALSILCFGIALIPFLKYLVGDINVDVNLNLIYLLSLLSTVSSYILSYKRSIIFANQKNYIINYITLFWTIILNVSQLSVLFLTKNYYIYLTLKIVVQILENITLYLAANKLYPYLKESNSYKLSKQDEKNIFQKVKALFFHQIGTIIVNGTDNILISFFLGISVVGVYSNYYMIINYVSILIAQIINSCSASVGNLVATDVSPKRFTIFNKIRFLNFTIVLYAGSLIFTLIQPFIELWIGKEYLIEFSVLVILLLNFYQTLMRRSFAIFKDAAGIWLEDKFVPLIESVINIVFSIILGHFLGLLGIFIGTFLSGLVIWLYSYPEFVYKKLFERDKKLYYKETLGYFSLYTVIIFVVYLINNLFQINNLIVLIIARLLFTLVFITLVIILIFHNSSNFKFIKELIYKYLKKINSHR